MSDRRAWERLLDGVTLAGGGIAALGTIVAGPSALMAALATLSVGVGVTSVARRSQRVTRETYTLPDQHPNLRRLVDQLRVREDVLIARYRRGRRLYEVIVEETLALRKPPRSAQVEPFAVVLQRANGKAVLFFGRRL